MSAIEIPGLDIEERSPGTYRVRVRVHPFFALTSTTSTELEAVQWGCGELARLHALHERLCSEGQLPSKALTRAAAIELGIAHLISGDRREAPTPVRAASVGSAILVDDILDTYMAGEGKELTAGYFSRSKRLKAYFGGLTLACVTTATIKEYVEARLRGELGAVAPRRLPTRPGTASTRRTNGGGNGASP